MTPMRAIACVTLPMIVLVCGCGSSDEGTGGSGGGATESSSAGGLGGAGGSLGVGASGNAGGGSGAEVCDGVDNDGNGIVDDVDVGNDGICDCLRIATLGVPGTWGVGDVFAAWLDARSDNGAIPLGDQVLTKALLDPFQVVVAEDLSKMNRAYAPEEVAALSDWVATGGGFM